MFSFYQFCIFFGTVFLALNIIAEEEVLPDCKTVMMKLAKQHLRAFSSCVKDMKADTLSTEEYEKKMNCSVKCVLEKGGLLNEEKKVTKEKVQEYMDKHVPTVYHDIGHEVSVHCYDEFGPQMDHDDEYCHAYGKFIECMQDVMSNVAEACSF